MSYNCSLLECNNLKVIVHDSTCQHVMEDCMGCWMIPILYHINEAAHSYPVINKQVSISLYTMRSFIYLFIHLFIFMLNLWYLDSGQPSQEFLSLASSSTAALGAPVVTDGAGTSSGSRAGRTPMECSCSGWSSAIWRIFHCSWHCP